MLPQESKASSAEHLACEHLDPVDVFFDDAGVPGQGEAGDGGLAVDAGGEGVEAGQILLADRIGPLGEPVALAFGADLCEGPDVPGEGFQFGAAGQDGLSRGCSAWGVAEDPAGDGVV